MHKKKSFWKHFILVCLSLATLTIGTAHAYSCNAKCNFHFQHGYDLKMFIREMAAKYNFDAKDLKETFSKVTLEPQILENIHHPAEQLTWDQYRKIFLTEGRIDGGVAYFKKHAAVLEQAEKEYGVPANIIVAIVGVESFYGQRSAQYSVLNTLTTLSFFCPAREKFFKNELKEYLLLTRELAIDPLEPRGSYAGAMGLPQFMPSSYRKYAIDTTHKNHADILHDTDDVIFSIANYLNAKGWQAGEPITTAATVSGDDYKNLDTAALEAKYTIDALAKQGVTGKDQFKADTNANLIILPNDDQNEYWLGFNNFYVITRYNGSPLYVMAVYQLADAISHKMQYDRKK